MIVSVLIPVFNSESYLQQTIESVIAQSIRNIEIVAVDDGSTDSSLSILERLKKLHKNIIVFSQPNSGACAARNKAFEHSSGKYIQYLDADDILAPDKIAKQIKLFEKYGDDIIVSGQWGRFYDNPEEAVFPKRYLDKDWDNPIDWLVNSWERRGMAQTGSWLTPRKLIENSGPWNETLKINQDGEFFCRVLLHAKSIKFYKEAKVYYRSGLRESISKKPGRGKSESLLRSFQLYKAHVLPVENSIRVKHALMINFLRFIYENYSNFPDLVEIAKKEIKELGYERLEVVGGKHFRMVANMIGFENTLKLRSIIRLYKLL